jgi:hypothetical protein
MITLEGAWVTPNAEHQPRICRSEAKANTGISRGKVDTHWLCALALEIDGGFVTESRV